LRPDPLDEALAPESNALAAAVWRGYIVHSLLFYRQNNLKNFTELVQMGGGVSLKPSRFEPGGHAFHVQRGLLRYERYWGSLRLSDSSLPEFERAVALEPDSVWGHLFCGMTHEMHRRYTRAIACFDRAHALRPRWSWPLILRGICRWYLAQFKEAVTDLSAAARLDPKSELPLLFLGRAKADLRDRSLLQDLDRALALAPDSGFALSWRGRAFFILKKNPQALADLRRSIRALPDYDRGYSWLGVSYVEMGQWARALPLLEKANRLNPYYPTTLYPLAQAAMRLGKWKKAESALKAAADIDRHGVWVEHRIHMSHPNPACLRSKIELDRFLARSPQAAWAWSWRGQTELLLKNYERAIADLDEGIRLAPREPWAYAWRGEAYRRRGLCREAGQDFRRAITLSPKLSWAHAGLGYCLLHEGRLRPALAALNRSLRLQGHCPQALAWRAEAQYRLGSFAEAVRDWESSLELYPHDPLVYGWLWKAKARLGDWQGVLKALEDLQERIGKRSDRLWSLLGWASGRVGRESEAAQALARATKLNDREPVALLETACWWARHGEKKRAAWVVDQALAALEPGLRERLADWTKRTPRHLDTRTVEALRGSEELCAARD
jgi:tetratricopeptide (TPR) repeat protein